MGKRKFYCTMILTVGSLAWTMYSLPDQIEAVESAKPGSHVRHASGETASRSNEFDTLPDIDALLDIARQSRRAVEGDHDGTRYTPDPTLSNDQHQALVEKSRHAHVRDR